MSTNEDLFKRLRESIESAQKTLKVKEKIEEELNHVLSEINKLLGNSVTFEVLDSNGERHFSSSSKIIHLSKSGVNFGPSFILFGFSISENTGYPVIIETSKNLFNCNSDSELKGCIGDILTEEKNSIILVKVASEDPPIPF